MHSRACPITLLVTALLTAACAGDPMPTAPTPATSPVASTASHDGPDRPPNVVRYEQVFSFSILDPDTRLLAVAGLPADPLSWAACGGSEPRELFAVQEAGALKDAINLLVRATEIPVHLYDPTTFIGVCRSTPVASGVGQASYIDNDAVASGTRMNTWGFRIVADMELATGGTARLMAVSRSQLRPDGTVRVMVQKVQLVQVP